MNELNETTLYNEIWLHTFCHYFIIYLFLAQKSWEVQCFRYFEIHTLIN
jgi:hypothetical protein